ncbi:MAG: hypothetical protein J5822_02515 [Eubacteriaceae bacterium]|nr:hypothetical protein [Eubacteriaceae bacterium]
MKKAAIILIALMLAVSFAACGGKDEGTKPDGGSGNTALGGWTVSDFEGVTLPEAAQNAYDKALEGYTGMGYVPYALLGTQVVSGTNYMILAKGTTVTAEPVSALYVLVIYEDLEGSCTVASVSDFDLGAIEESDSEGTPYGLAGGWAMNTEVTAAGFDPAILNAIDGASEAIDGYYFTPLVLLGEKVVNGTEYAVLGIQFDGTEYKPDQYCVLFPVIASDGTASVEKIALLDLGSFNE